MSEIRLTPAGQLRWDSSSDGSSESGRLAALRERFEADWREGLFELAAARTDAGASLTLRYWQGFAELYLTALCHIPESMWPLPIEPPSPAEFSTRVLTAPPMQGGEYLSAEVLQALWDALAQWGEAAVQTAGGLGAFLEARAALWRQVGRVCFHLAENKTDEHRPFAFMATYVSGMGAGGKARHLPLRQALEQYAGAQNRPALVKLLSPVQAAAERLAWVKALVDSGDIYRPLAWPAERAYQFLLGAAALEESGLSVRLPDWWRRRPRPQVAVSIGGKKPPALGAGAILDFSVGVALGDETLSPEEIEALLSSGADGLVRIKGQWVEVDRDKLREAIAHWEALRREARGGGGISFVEGMRLLAGASADLKHEPEAEAERAWVHVEAGEAMRQILSGLRDPAGLAAVEPAGIRATLRPYQRHGVSWLRFLSELGLGACLADDMGLGKTLQVLALLQHAREAGHNGSRGPSLLVVPASLLGNWRAEAARFAPALSLVFLHPSETDRAALARIEQAPAAQLATADLAVTTYAMLTRQSWLEQVDWRLVVLDEAQAIKNPATRQAKAVRRLKAHARLALTGTPVENRLGDLWSIFDFLNPGLLGSPTIFKKFVQGLEGRAQDQFAPLRRLVAPYILRRMKTDRAIIADLPEKTEAVQYCQLSRAQVRLYEQAVQAMEQALKAESTDGIKRRALVLQTLMRLKQICNHPSQFAGDGDFAPEASGKFLRLAEIGEELAERQERVLVFTQFREIIEPLAGFLAAVFGRAGLVLHGATSVGQRRQLVEQFQREDGPPFFILSLKAGGTGLNLTAASHVIHFDRWWNPAVEDQATDRAFRIGQRKNVLVHKFVTRGTVEERIDKMIEEKRQLAGEILASGGEVDVTSLSDDALLDLVRLDVKRAAE